MAGATAFLAINLWTGAPLVALWVGSKTVGRSVLSMEAVFVVVIVLALLLFPMVMALYHPFCTPKLQSTMPPWEAPLAEFWQRPGDIATRDLYYGPWGNERAPDA